MKMNLIPWKKKERAGTPWEQHDSFGLLHRRMNDLFDHFFEETLVPSGMPVSGRGNTLNSLVPQVEVTETDDDLQVTAELPGLDEKDLSVTLENNTLTISGEKKQEKEEKKKNYRYSECSYGCIYRTVPLPVEVEDSGVQARFKKGVLSVTLPKKEKGRKPGRHIEITSG